MASGSIYTKSITLSFLKNNLVQNNQINIIVQFWIENLLQNFGLFRRINAHRVILHLPLKIFMSD